MRKLRSENSFVQGSRVSESQSQSVKLWTPCHHTTQLSEPLDPNYSQNLWWPGFGEWQQKKNNYHTEQYLKTCPWKIYIKTFEKAGKSSPSYLFCTLQTFTCLSWTSHWSIKHDIKIHTRETFVILWSVNCHLSVIKMFLTVKWFWKIIEKLKLKVLLFSSLPHATCPGFAGKRTKKIWWASTWLGCRAPRKGLWNFHRKTSPRSFWGWTYTIMWKSECKFKDFYPLREKYCALSTFSVSGGFSANCYSSSS